MTRNARHEIYLKALQMKGVEHQLDRAIEEMSELTKEICKAKRGYDNRDKIVEEFADVMVCLEQLEIIFSIKEEEIRDGMHYKVFRLDERLRNNIKEA